jgi:hypothetical protein
MVDQAMLNASMAGTIDRAIESWTHPHQGVWVSAGLTTSVVSLRTLTTV